jgi:serine/threonine protein kinase
MSLLIIVLFAQDVQLWKICDFGLTSKGTSTRGNSTQYARGKQGYRAPELLLESMQSFNKKVDIWSLGCIMYELSVGTKPFNNDWATLQFAQEKMSKEVVIPGASTGVYKDLEALICKMLDANVQDRPSVGSILAALGRLATTLKANGIPVRRVPPFPRKELFAPQSVESELLGFSSLKVEDKYSSASGIFRGLSSDLARPCNRLRFWHNVFGSGL